MESFQSLEEPSSPLYMNQIMTLHEQSQALIASYKAIKASTLTELSSVNTFLRGEINKSLIEMKTAFSVLRSHHEVLTD
jgi:hypothetical protein